MIKLLSRIGLALVTIALIAALGFRLNAWWQEAKTVDQVRPANGRFIQTPHGNMHISIWGDAKGIPVVMTHGMAAWGGLWQETAIALAAKGYRVIAVDQPPFGFSDRHDQDFSRSAQANRIGALVATMQLKSYFLVGHSYGGGVAAETALRWPQNIAGLVLVCPVMKLNKADQSAAIEATVPMPLNIEPLAQTLVAATVTNPLMTGFLAKRFMHRTESLSAQHIEILQQPLALQGNTKQVVSWLRQFLKGDVQALSRNRNRLATLKIPVSLIWGEQDQVTPIAQGEELAGVLEPVSFTRLKNIGHMPQLEDNGGFNESLLKALGN